MADHPAGRSPVFGSRAREHGRAPHRGFRGLNGARSLSAVSWLHGTSVHKTEAASVNPNSADRRAALLFAAAGRAVSAPDYVGLGKGDGLHPHGDPTATVAAAVDGLRAARTLAREHGRKLRPEVGISGFSQGGPATRWSAGLSPRSEPTGTSGRARSHRSAGPST
ncbi:lipase family protein [Streptomyces sp. NPDC049906]|uniref:lipase family protein n=1 Tax=Streptomyces sp. NPDC049906 TaxID=3155656 RepID=UPI00343B4202